MNHKTCAVIPVYNHHTCLEQIVAVLLANQLPCILVDDGSDATTKHEIKSIQQHHPQVELLSLPENRGKGAAVMAGLARASERGFSHAMQVDADGQHALEDIPAMLDLSRKYPDCLVSGLPIFDESIPAVRFYGRNLTHAMVILETLSFQLRDTMCGFRVYPVEPMMMLSKRISLGLRMDFDTDSMVRLYWSGTGSVFLPTKVHYPKNGISHFRMISDNARMTWLHIRLLLGMLIRMPKLIYRKTSGKQHRDWAQIGERGSLLGLRFIGFIDRSMGRFASLLILYPVTAYFFLTHPRARRASRRFLKAAGTKPTLTNRFSHFMHFSVSILDKVASWHDPARLKVEFPQHDMLLAEVTHGQGVLLLSAHLGNTEVARAISATDPYFRCTSLVYTANAKKVNAMLELTNAASRNSVIQVQTIGPDTAVMLREKITTGESVVCMGDRTPVSADSPVVKVEFLGRPAPFAIGPYVLAHLLECPVFLFFCLYHEHGYRIHMEPFAERICLPRKGRLDAAAIWAGRYAQRLAHYAVRFPLQWYNFYDFWAENVTSYDLEMNVSHQHRSRTQHGEKQSGKAHTHRWAEPHAE